MGNNEARKDLHELSQSRGHILCKDPKSGWRDHLLLERPSSASKNITHKPDRSRGCVDKRRSKYSHGRFLLQSFQRKKSASCWKVHACNWSPRRLQTTAYRRLVLKSGATEICGMTDFGHSQIFLEMQEQVQSCWTWITGRLFATNLACFITSSRKQC